MQLGDDDPLCSVDDEGTVVGHQRDLAQIDLLLLDVLDRLVLGVLVIDHQTQFDPQRCRIGGSAKLALLDVKHWRPEPIIHIFQRRIAGIADDWENGIEGGLQPLIGTLVCWNILLQELAIGVDLDSQQIRDIQNVAPLPEIFTDAFFLGERVGHH